MSATRKVRRAVRAWVARRGAARARPAGRRVRGRRPCRARGAMGALQGAHRRARDAPVRAAARSCSRRRSRRASPGDYRTGASTCGASPRVAGLPPGPHLAAAHATGEARVPGLARSTTRGPWAGERFSRARAGALSRRSPRAHTRCNASRRASSRSSRSASACVCSTVLPRASAVSAPMRPSAAAARVAAASSGPSPTRRRRARSLGSRSPSRGPCGVELLRALLPLLERAHPRAPRARAPDRRSSSCSSSRRVL